MMMKRGGRIAIGVGALMAFALWSSSVFAGPVNVTDGQIRYWGDVNWFHNDGQDLAFFQLQTPGGSADFPQNVLPAIMNTASGSADEYLFDGVVSLSPSSLSNDNYGGGISSGDFDGTGVVLTITGSLWSGPVSNPKPGGGSPDFLVENDTILIAEMDAASWTISENQDTRAAGSAFFTPTGDYLGPGDPASELTIGRFCGDFTLEDVVPNLSDFSTEGYAINPAGFGFGAFLKIVAIPEPATLLLLGVDGLMTLRKKRTV